jgi:GT2 family glycosyltransferase
VIVPTYRQWEYVKLCVESLGRTPETMVPCVIDDASPDWPGDRIVRGWLHASQDFVIMRYDRNGGLTRSWNFGAVVAREMGCDFVCFGNSDLVFPVGWEAGLIRACDDHSLVGPVTNAPGHSSGQAVEKYFDKYELSDDPDDIQFTQAKLGRGMAVESVRLNGFCMFARTEVIWEIPFSRGKIFDPGFPMVGNEDELVKRCWAVGRGAAYHTGSFVFHYRSVSRGGGRGKLDRGMVRLPEGCGECLSKMVSQEKNSPTKI